MKSISQSVSKSESWSVKSDGKWIVEQPIANRIRMQMLIECSVIDGKKDNLHI